MSVPSSVQESRASFQGPVAGLLGVSFDLPSAGSISRKRAEAAYASARDALASLLPQHLRPRPGPEFAKWTRALTAVALRAGPNFMGEDEAPLLGLLRDLRDGVITPGAVGRAQQHWAVARRRVVLAVWPVEQEWTHTETGEPLRPRGGHGETLLVRREIRVTPPEGALDLASLLTAEGWLRVATIACLVRVFEAADDCVRTRHAPIGRCQCPGCPGWFESGLMSSATRRYCTPRCRVSALRARRAGG